MAWYDAASVVCASIAAVMGTLLTAAILAPPAGDFVSSWVNTRKRYWRQKIWVAENVVPWIVVLGVVSAGIWVFMRVLEKGMS